MDSWFMTLDFNLLIPVIAVTPYAENALRNTFDKGGNRIEAKCSKGWKDE